MNKNAAESKLIQEKKIVHNMIFCVHIDLCGTPNGHKERMKTLVYCSLNYLRHVNAIHQIWCYSI